jgi:hypothetical protein
MNHNHEKLCKLYQIIKCHQYNLKPHYGRIQSNLAKAHIKTHHVIYNHYKHTSSHLISTEIYNSSN